MNLLSTSIQINKLLLHNRLVMPPMATSKSNDNGDVNQALCDYYTEKSNGNYIGLIIAEHSYISQEGKASKGQVSISKDADIPGLKRLVASIHVNGSKVFAQINHAGSAAKQDVTGCSVLSASSVPRPKAAADAPLPQEMTETDIKKVISDFAQAARRAKEAGFDGVEIHSAHGYLLNQFYSPLSNKRTDGYNGSSIEGRIRLHLEVIEAVRNMVGADYPVALRLGACDYMEGGSTLQDAVMASMAFEKAGIDVIDISGGFCGYMRPGATEQGYFGELTEAIKKNVSIPVILTGGIIEAQAANDLLDSHKADLIGVGRAILKDSDWAKHAMLGQ